MTEAEWIAFLRRPEIPAFNRAMLANPDDDLPRLVFADWLDENCPDPRVGAVVRQSMSGRPCTFHSLPVPAGVNVHADRGRLHLYLEHEQNTSSPDEHGCRAMWESGWVSRLNLQYSTPAAIEAWLAHPRMASVERLELTFAGVEFVEMVAAAEHLTTLSHLSLEYGRFGADGVRTLVAAKLPALRSLTLFDAHLGDDGAAVIATAPTLASLTALDLADNGIGPAGARALANSPHLTQLQSFRLAYNAIGDEGAAAVFGSPLFAGLRSLDLEGNEVGPVGVQALCDSAHITGLTTLKLGDNRIGDGGVRALAASPHLARLHTLELLSCFDSSAGAVALAESTNLPEVRSLDLSANPVGDAGLIALVSSPLFARLDKLLLGNCFITVVGLRAMAASLRFADSRPLDLWLSGNAFGEEVLAEADSFPPTLAAEVRNAVQWAIDTR